MRTILMKSCQQSRINEFWTILVLSHALEIFVQVYNCTLQSYESNLLHPCKRVFLIYFKWFCFFDLESPRFAKDLFTKQLTIRLQKCNSFIKYIPRFYREIIKLKSQMNHMLTSQISFTICLSWNELQLLFARYNKSSSLVNPSLYATQHWSSVYTHS